MSNLPRLGIKGDSPTFPSAEIAPAPSSSASSSSSNSHGALGKIGASAALMAWALWFGGLVALGAITAPLVFRNVPAPFNADAMTLVFRRFDGVALACATILLVREIAALRTTRAGLDILRAGSAVLAGALAVLEGVWLSPAIEALHRGGAVRHVGELGERLDVLHSYAEAVGKVELLCLAVFVVLYTFTSPSRATRS